MSERAGAVRRAGLGLLGALGLGLAAPAAAHVPHDVVTDVAVSPGFRRDGTLFAIVRTNLLRSTDAGRSWQRLTRGAPGAPRVLAVSSAYPRDATLFVGSPAGVHRSRDRGASWSLQTRGAEPRDVVGLVVAPDFEGAPVVLAATAGGALFRSGDAGESWQRVPAGEDVSALRWTPEALLAGTGTGRVQRSLDSGWTWRPYTAVPEAGRVRALEPLADAEGDLTLLVAADTGLFRSVPGRSAERLGVGGPDEPIASLAVLGHGDERVLLAATEDRALFRSENGGARWQLAGAGLETDPQAELGGSQFGVLRVSAEGDVLLGSFSGVFLSRDAGLSFEKLHSLSKRIIVGLATSPRTASGYEIAITTYGGGIEWKRAGEPGWQRALVRARLGAVAYAPTFATDRTLLSGMFDAIIRSVDGGSHWRPVPVAYEKAPASYAECPRGEPPGPPAEIVARAPRLFSFQFPLGFAFSPDYAADGSVFAAYRPEGLVRSSDGGASFRKLWHGCGSPVWSLVLSPGYPEDPVLFASTNDGVFRSADAGGSWQRVGSQLGHQRASLAISPGFATDRTIYAGGGQGLWRSRDAGERWRLLTLAGRREPIAAGGLAVAPVAGAARELFVQVLGGPLYRGRDTGEALEVVELEAPAELSQMRGFDRDRVPLLAFSPDYARDATLYGASMDRLYVSVDRGASWAPVARDPAPSASTPPAP